MSPTLPGDDEVRRLAAEILARDEYSGPQKMLRGLEALLESLRSLLRGIGVAELADSNPLLYWAIEIGLIALAALLIAHIVWSLRRALAAPAAAARTSPASVDADFAAEADELARQGRFLEAARRLQLGVLDSLLRGRRLELSRSDANRVLRRRLLDARIGDRERNELLGLLDRFETRWFRDRAEDPDLYHGWRALYARLASDGSSA